MITITKKQFKKLCGTWRAFKDVNWPKHRKEMYLSELIEMAWDADVSCGAIQWAMWKYDHCGWSNAFDVGGYKHLVVAYLDKQKESDMEVKELVKLFRKHNKKNKTRMAYITIHDDGSGEILNDSQPKRFLLFDEIDELLNYLKAESYQKPPDYKSLFSVVGGKLAADFSDIEITGKNALPLSIAKWEVVVDYLERMGHIIDNGMSFTCACCQLRVSCSKCPVGKEGYMNCGKTPYQDYISAQKENNFLGALQAARAEVEFLKSLMEK